VVLQAQAPVVVVVVAEKKDQLDQAEQAIQAAQAVQAHLQVPVVVKAQAVQMVRVVVAVKVAI
jgi:hypothetical protein